MQPILMLAVVGVAAVALGTGFLNNDIELWVQQFGVGDEDISSPVDHVQVDFNIAQIPSEEVSGTFENVIDICYLTLDDDIGDPNNSVKLSELTCKLTGKTEDGQGNWVPSGQIIAEGTVCASNFAGGVPIPVPIGDNDCPGGVILGPTEVDVKMVGDVIVVVHANTYSATDADGNTVVMNAAP